MNDQQYPPQPPQWTPPPPGYYPPPPSGNISIGGIQKYWPQLVAIGMAVFWLYQQGQEQQKFVNRLEKVETAVADVRDVKAAQVTTAFDVNNLKSAISDIQKSQRDSAEKLDALAQNLGAVSRQVEQLSIAFRRGSP